MNIIYELLFDGYVYHVVAPTRNKARVAFIAWYGGELEYTTPMNIRILGKNVDMTEGVDEKSTWARKNHVSIYFWEFLDEFKDIACQTCCHLLWEADNGTVFCPECQPMLERST